MIDIYNKYCNNNNKPSLNIARFLTIYIEEAHAYDEWWLPDSPNAKKGEKAYISNHKSQEERLVAANKFVNDFKFPIETVSDVFNNEGVIIIDFI